MTQRDDTWATLDRLKNISGRLQRGEPVDLTADFIREHTDLDPRLAVKFDTPRALPRLLREPVRTILPLGSQPYGYRVLPGNGYQPMPAAESEVSWSPGPIAGCATALPWETGPTSEQQALLMARHAGILDDFLGATDRDPLRETFSGRCWMDPFRMAFELDDGRLHRMTVEGVQCEVDRGLESRDAFFVVEAKLGNRDFFHGRQLYYPLRAMARRCPGKYGYGVFLTYSDRVFRLRLYSYTHLRQYHSLAPLAACDYLLETDPGTPDLGAVLERTEAPDTYQQGAPWPQADRLDRVIDLVDQLGRSWRSAEEAAHAFDLTSRQVSYYVNAAVFLDLAERETYPLRVRLTDAGARFQGETRRGRREMIAEALASRPVFRAAIEDYMRRGRLPGRQLHARRLGRLRRLDGEPVVRKPSVLDRRAQTVAAWLDEIVET